MCSVHTDLVMMKKQQQKRKNNIVNPEDQYMIDALGRLIAAFQKLLVGLLVIAVGAPLVFGWGEAKIPEHVVMTSIVCLVSSVLCILAIFALEMNILKRFRQK